MIVPNKYEAASMAVLAALILTFERFLAGTTIFSIVSENTQVTWLNEFLLSNGKAISRTLTLSAAIFFVLSFRQIGSLLAVFLSHARRSQYAWLVMHLALFFIFLRLTPVLLASDNPFYPLIWLLLAACLMITIMLAIAHCRFWWYLIRQHGRQLLLALAIGSLVWWLGSTTQTLWNSMNHATFMLVFHGLELIHGEVYISLTETQKIIGIDNFLVNIAPACSGYEGIGLITAFTAVYLYSFREDFRFPLAFLLFPLAAIIIWLFNALRIIALINIGEFWSPEVAVWGFHSQAGWITFIVASLLLMLIAHRSSLFTKRQKEAAAKAGLNLPMATLIPLIALLGSTLITQAFSAQFDWLYPLRVLVTAVAIGLCWKALALRPFTISHWSWIGGLAVALIWLAIVPASAETDQVFSETIHNAPSLAVGIWLIFRFVGSVVTVPIAEELGFRAYLLCRLSSMEVAIRGRITFSAIGFISSSLAFGFLHGAWVAGTVAGLIYAFVRYKSEHIADAILAHALTNALLFIYVIYTGHWSVL